MDYKRLVSSAPASSILNAQTFRYTNSLATDIRKTFARLKRGGPPAPLVAAASNVRPLKRKMPSPRLVSLRSSG